ncbi:MAG: VanZ family protein [Bacteroidota bacterium]|jgi:VanZ family protein|nr:VanZ family protein [Algoriphagus sp.]
MPRLLLAVLWLSLCCLAMLTPGSAFPEINAFDFQDKAIHFICFFIQSYLWVGLGIKKMVGMGKKMRFLVSLLVFALLPGILLESAQNIIPNRTFDWVDLSVNAIGGIFGFFIYLYRPYCKFILD